MSPGFTLKGLKFKAMVDKIVELADRELRGVTGRQIIAFASAIIIACTMYFTMMGKIGRAAEKSTENGDALKELITSKNESEKDKKEVDRLLNIRLTAIELEQREFKVRLDVLESKSKD